MLTIEPPGRPCSRCYGTSNPLIKIECTCASLALKLKGELKPSVFICSECLKESLDLLKELED